MANKIQFWLSYNNREEVIQLPVNPATLAVNYSGNFQDISVMGLGEFTVIGDTALTEYSFSSFLPSNYSSNYCEYTDIPNPKDVVKMIERWRDSRRPIRLIITGTPINVAVTIRSFNYDLERAGSPNDIYYELTLKEYRFLDYSRIYRKQETNSSQTKKVTKREDTRKQPTTYKVTSNDSLWKIAQRVYGKGSLYMKIYEANKAKIGKDPNVIKAGMELIIPR